MSRFLTNLAAKAVGEVPALKPRPLSVYEPEPPAERKPSPAAMAKASAFTSKACRKGMFTSCTAKASAPNPVCRCCTRKRITR